MPFNSAEELPPLKGADKGLDLPSYEIQDIK